MKCKRCGENGAERLEVRYHNGSTVIVYICKECAEAERRSKGVREILSSPAT